MDVIHNINEHTLTHIAPSKYGEDGIGVFASTQIKAGTLLFQLPYGFSVGTIKISGEEDSRVVEVKMTLTAQGCGMGPVIAEDAKTRIESLPQVNEVTVDIVWEPAWNPRMMSEEGKKVLGLE